MTLSHARLSQADEAGPGQQSISPAASLGAGTSEREASHTPASAYGSTPSAVVSVSAQAAKAMQVKAYAIKHGHDPDGLQDGK